jgi:tetratricopeptide (TPR) repeat protein
MSVKDKRRNPVTTFFGELKRRRVLQMGGAYIAGAWVGVEILHFLLEQFLAPGWTYRFVAIVFVVGFPLAMVLAWIVQVRDDGSWALDPARGDHRTLAAAIVLGVLVTGGFSWLIVPDREPEPAYEPLRNSLVVIPFPDSMGSYRSLIAGLEQARELTLVHLEPGDLPGDLYGFGRELGVAYLAVGAPHMRLLDIAGGQVAWEQTFAPDDPQAIANALLAAMSLPALSREEFMGTGNALAFDAYLSGRRHAAGQTASALRSATDEFQRAIELDRGYVRAHVGLAEAIYELLPIETLESRERDALRSRAEAAAELAQKLDRESGAVISLLGLAEVNPQLRVQAFERALELDRDHCPSYYRYALRMKADGDLAEAERLMNRALTFCPMDARFREELAAIQETRRAADDTDPADDRN